MLALGAFLQSLRWPPARASWLRLAGIALGVAVAGGFIVLLIWRTELSEIRRSLAGMSLPILVGAVAVYFVNVWLQALRWHLLIGHMGSPGSGSLFPPLVIGIMGSNLLPLRMGTVLRAEYLWSRFRLQTPAVLSAIVVEGWLDGLVLAVLFLPVLAIVAPQEAVVKGILFAGGIAAASLLLVRLALSKGWGRRLPSLPLPKRLEPLLTSLLQSFIKGLASLRSARTLSAATAVSVVAWLVKAAVFYLVGLAFSLDMDWSDYLVVTAALSGAGALQVSQGNMGPYEFVVAEVMVGLGAARGDAAAYAIVSHAVLFVPVTVLGLAFFIWHRLSLPTSGAGAGRATTLVGAQAEGVGAPRRWFQWR